MINNMIVLHEICIMNMITIIMLTISTKHLHELYSTSSLLHTVKHNVNIE